MTTMTRSTGLTVAGTLHFVRRGRGGRREARTGPTPAAAPERVPRLARLMALALKFERLIREGVVSDYAELARLGRVTRARVTQIMNLLHLAPDLQEAILFLPAIERGRDPLVLCDLQPITATPDWRQQRKLWVDLAGRLSGLRRE